MVVDAIAEPHAFGVGVKSFPVGAVAVAFVAAVHRFKGFAHREVVFAVLVVDDVAASQSSFRQVIDECFLL